MGSDVPKIEGPLDPRRIPSDRPGTGKLDPTQFRKVMEVDKSDETQQQNKRNLPKSEEDEELEEEHEEAPVVLHASFSDYLKEPNENDSVFASREGKGPQLVSDTEVSEAPTPTHIFAQDKADSKRSQKEAPSEVERPPSSKKTKKVDVEKAPPVVVVQKQKKVKEEKPLPESLLPPKVPQEKILQEEVFKTEKKGEEIKEKEVSPLPPPVQKSIESSISPLSSARDEEEVALKKRSQTQSAEKERKKDQEESEKKARFDATLASTPLPVSPLEISTSNTAPAYATLSPEIFELFEKLVGLLMVQQYKGISTTTIELHMPNSPFNGAKIILEQHQTAPGSFNLQLVGSPKAVDLFMTHLDDLSSAFTQSNLGFKVNILRPSLESKKRIVQSKKDASKETDK